MKLPPIDSPLFHLLVQLDTFAYLSVVRYADEQIAAIGIQKSTYSLEYLTLETWNDQSLTFGMPVAHRAKHRALEFHRRSLAAVQDRTYLSQCIVGLIL